MNVNFYQYDCNETIELDLRQADAILEHKPDIVILEYPNNNKIPGVDLNNYLALQKPKNLVDERTKEFSAEILKIHPWAKADTIMWKNIASLWEKDHQVLVYTVDAPSELTNELREIWNHSYPCIKNNWIWWVQIYIREKYMEKNIEWALQDCTIKNPTVLIFLQSFHWDHVKFLMKKPNNDEIWKYYFGKFSEINRKQITPEIAKINSIFYKHWMLLSDFNK